eukprot:scaffold83788_cov24-Phaeocystis_antarctica.AAC.1
MSSAVFHRGTCRRWGASPARPPCLTAAGRSRCKQGSAPRAKARRARRQRAARRRRRLWQPRSRPSAPPAPREPPWWPLQGPAAASEAWRAAA